MKNVFILLITISLLHLIISNDEIIDSFEEEIQKSDKDITLPETGNKACSQVTLKHSGTEEENGKTCSVASIDKGYKCCYIKKKSSSNFNLAYDCYYFPDNGDILSDVAKSKNIDIICSSNYLTKMISLFLLLLIL
jgi:hypothetical protein